jgi:PAS domain S-box-containing protein
VSNERFVLAAEAAGLGFWDFDIETQTSLWDDQMYRLYGLSRSDGLDVSVRRSLLHPDDRARIDEALRDAAAGWRNFESEFRILQADGRVRHLKSAASLKRDGSGRGARLLGVCFDVTERREVQEALEQARDAAEAANRAKTDFLAVMSHEIRTPMNGIMGMNALLLDTELTSRQRKMTETIRDSSNSLLSIIDDILDVSKLESGKIELDEIDFDLVDLIEKTIELFAPRAEQKGLSLSADLRSVSRSALNGDAPRLRQIVLNLVSNAIKFTSMGSVTIRVATTDAGAGRTRVRCEVLDTGTGMNDAAKQRLFKPFHQGDSSISRQFGGTGLGLSICKRLVELMEGRIEVSDRPGGGSVFWFEIVARNAIEGFARPRKDQVDENNASPRARSGRILLAEDNPVNVDVATMILEGAGYEVDVAADGVEAVDAIRRRRYDLVLMDMQMPHLDGLAATREIRAAPSGARLPIVAMTANAMKEDQRRCLEAGMDDYFSKPFSPAILVERVAQWIDRFAMPNPPEAAPEPDAVEAFPVVDLAATEDLVAALPAARFHALLRRSLSGMEGQMEKFARLDPIADVAEIGREAHKLVSSAGTFGARRVQHLAGDLEQACLAGDSAYAEELMRQIVPAAAAAAAELRVRYIARH